MKTKQGLACCTASCDSWATSLTYPVVTHWAFEAVPVSFIFYLLVPEEGRGGVEPIPTRELHTERFWSQTCEVTVLICAPPCWGLSDCKTAPLHLWGPEECEDPQKWM